MIARRRDAALVPLGTAALALAVVWPIVVAPGLPLFLHDWIWSPYAASTLWTWHFLISTWRETGLGEPNSAISLNPLAWLKLLFAAVATGRVSLELYLFCSVWGALGGVYDIARRSLRASVSQAFASAALFASTPSLFDKIASGQSSYWAATAAFAWGLSWCLRSFESGTVRDAARASALFALATIQLHFLLFAWMAYLAGWLAYRRAGGLALLGATGATCLAIPELWFLVLRGPERGADVSPQYRYWIESQSSHGRDAFAMLGYAVKYAEHAVGGEPYVGIVRTAAYTAALLAIVAVLRERRPAAFAIAALGAAGALMTMGGFGPLGTAVTFASLHFADLGLLREFYHASVLYAIALATLAPAGAARLLPRMRLAPVAVSLALAGLLGLATWTGGLGRVLPFVSTPAYDDRLRSAIASAEARVLFLPAQQPLRVAGDPIGGNDGTDWVDAAHHSVYRFYLPPLVAHLEAALAAGDAETARRSIARLGISAVIYRNDVVSGAYPSPTARERTLSALAGAFGAPLAVAPGIAMFAVDAFAPVGVGAEFRPLPPDLAFEGSRADAFVDEPGSDAGDTASGLVLEAPLPDLGWIRRRDAPATFAREAPATSYGIITTRAGASATLRAGTPGNALVWAPSGLQIGQELVRSERPVRVPLEAGSIGLLARGPAAISETGERVDPGAIRFPVAMVANVSHDAPWRYRFHLTLAGRAGIVLREAYDTAWRISAPGLVVERHERADGFANAWIVRGRGTYDVVADYGWQPAGFALLALSLAAFTGIALPAAVPASWWRRRAPRRDVSGGS